MNSLASIIKLFNNSVFSIKSASCQSHTIYVSLEYTLNIRPSVLYES